MIKSGDFVRLAAATNPTTSIIKSLEGRIGVVEKRWGNNLYVNFRTDAFPFAVLLFEREVEKINKGDPVTKIQKILEDREKAVVMKLNLIKTLDGGNMKHIIENTDLTIVQKLVVIAAEVYNPVTMNQLKLMFKTHTKDSFIKNAIERLEKLHLVYRKGDKVFPVVILLPPHKKNKEEKEKTVITDFDKDLLLFTQKLQEFYIEKSADPTISKKGRKQISSTVQWINTVLKKQFNNSFSKENAYSDYINFVLGSLQGDHLKHLKRLTYAATKQGWVHRTKQGFKHRLDKFDPYLLDKTKITYTQFFGINRAAIPQTEDIKRSGYYTTAAVFLLSRLEHERYPISTEVLYALEMLIVYYLYNRLDVDKLLGIHKLYVRQYDKAKKMGKLDNLLEYSKTGKINSFYCADCTLYSSCTKQGRDTQKCKDKITLSEAEGGE